mgnify:FL=1
MAKKIISFCFFLLILVEIFFPFNLLSQEVKVLTIDEAIKKALSSNPNLIALKLEAVAAKKRKEEVIANHFGEIDFIGSYNHYERNRILVPMAVDLFKNPELGMSQLPWDRNQTHYGITFTIPLFTGGTLFENDKIASYAEKSAKNHYLFSREELVYNVKSAYRNTLILKHALKSSSTFLEALEKDLEDYQFKFNLGQVASVDLQKIKFAYESAKSQYEEVKSQYTESLAVLCALLGEELGENRYELKDIDEGTDIPSLDEDIEKILLNRKDYLAQIEVTKMTYYKKLLAISAFSPKLVLQGTFLKNSAPSLPDDIYTRELIVGLKIPLFNGLKRVRTIEEASINLEIARQKEKAKKLEIETHIIKAKERIATAKALYEAGVAQRNLGQEIARIEKLKLEQGSGKMEDYLNARAQELNGETSYWRGFYLLQNSVDYYRFVSGKGDTNE